MNEQAVLGQQEEFTFKKLWALIKKSGFRIIIFCLIAAFVMGAITLGVYIAKKDEATSFVTSIEYVYTGAQGGNLPNEQGRLDVNQVLSPAIVNGALTTLGIKNVAPSDVITRLTVSGVIPANVDLKTNPNYFPTKYNVTLTDAKGLKLKKDKANALLNEIVGQYIKFFQRTYFAVENVSDIDLSDIVSGEVFQEGAGQKDYLQVLEVLKSEVGSIISVLSTYAVTSPSFAVEGMTFANLQSKFNAVLSQDILWVESDIVTNTVTINPVKLKNYYDQKILFATQERNRLIGKPGSDGIYGSDITINGETITLTYGGLSGEYQKQLLFLANADIGSNTILVPGSNTYTVSQNNYVNTINTINTLWLASVKAGLDYEAEISLYKMYSTALTGKTTPSPAGQRENATNQLISIATKTQDLIALANNAMAAYSDTTAVESVRQSHSSVPRYDGKTLMILLIVDIAVIVAAFIAAVAVTKKKIDINLVTVNNAVV